MGGILHAAKVGGMAPFFGADPSVVGSRVSNPSGPAYIQSPEDQAAAEAAQAKLYQDQQAAEQARHQTQAQGFMGAMMPHAGLSAGLGRAAVPPPPQQWTYQPGKGPVWQTPERTINRQGEDAQSMNWKLADSKPGSPYGGNRF